MSELRKSLLSKIKLDQLRVRPYQGFIFLCGGPADAGAERPVSVRDAIYRELAKTDSIECRIRLAEHYKDWAHDSIYRDLVTFEKHLAELSSVIVLVLESPGALTELGLFSAIGEFREKLLVFIDTTHYKSSSFIRLGPINFLEKVHENYAECHRWLTTVGNSMIFDPEAAVALQGEFADSIKARLKNTSTEHPFQSDRWLHRALLICDLLNLMSALTVREIRDNLMYLGLNQSETEVKQALYLLDRVQMLAVEPRGDQRFYVAISDRQFLKLNFNDKTFDVNRFRSDLLDEYSRTDIKRFRAITDVRKRR